MGLDRAQGHPWPLEYTGIEGVYIFLSLSANPKTKKKKFTLGNKGNVSCGSTVYPSQTGTGIWLVLEPDQFEHTGGPPPKTSRQAQD